MRNFTLNKTLRQILALLMILCISTESLALSQSYIRLVNRHTFVGIVVEVKHQSKTQTKTTEGRPGTGAAIGGGIGWYALGGPLAIIGGAVIGSKIGANKAKTVTTTNQSLIIVARNIQNNEIHYLTVQNDVDFDNDDIYSFAKNNVNLDIISSLQKGQKIKIPSDHELQVIDSIEPSFIYLGNEKIPHLK